jgi:hypothetical protein
MSYRIIGTEISTLSTAGRIFFVLQQVPRYSTVPVEELQVTPSVHTWSRPFIIHFQLLFDHSSDQLQFDGRVIGSPSYYLSGPLNTTDDGDVGDDADDDDDDPDASESDTRCRQGVATRGGRRRPNPSYSHFNCQLSYFRGPSIACLPITKGGDTKTEIKP